MSRGCRQPEQPPSDNHIFTEEAIAAIFNYSRGLPRLINTICENALITAYAKQLRSVTPDMIEEVAREFRFDMPRVFPDEVSLNRTPPGEEYFQATRIWKRQATPEGATMSNIFDALQRSENEQAGSDSSRPAKATELLQRAEHRAVSNWEATVVDVEPEATSFADNNEIAGRDTSLLAEAVAAAPGNAERLSADERSEILSRFQSLPISLPSHSRIVCLTDKESPTAEAIRLLGVRLRDLRRVRQLKKVLITSTIPQEGKSTIAANLACALAHAPNERTLLVEGDLRRPSLSQMFGIQKCHGISEWLQGESGPPADIYHLEEAGLWLLPAGDATSNPIELLQSHKLPTVMEQLAACGLIGSLSIHLLCFRWPIPASG